MVTKDKQFVCGTCCYQWHVEYAGVIMRDAIEQWNEANRCFDHEDE